ncbi:alpha/beta hydrolase family protein [Novosphingobium malaysiense]|uniref:Esterase n=1 Tax=Novosphingobium malaysiense TaxID=1348853 RepID=A0A0B1ZMB4_9SPHN|nr:hypothetical protein [Novosphingobium malaysiense]KHK90333.1 hypothetical protein LK12_17120 [Novosphingobium malaysiense]
MDDRGEQQGRKAGLHIDRRAVLAGSVALASTASLGVAPAAMAGHVEGPASGSKLPLVLSRVGSFMVGGQLKPALLRHTLGDGTDANYEATIWANQMYVQCMIPAHKRHKYPVVFVHGGGCTGKSFEETPDGREGWVHYFARQGFDTYWVDKPWRGRSGFDPTQINRALESNDASLIPSIHSPAAKEVLDAASWGFGELTTRETILTGIKETVPDFTISLEGAKAITDGGPIIYDALIALLERIGPAVLIGHSQGGSEVFGPLHERPDLVAGVMAVEPAVPPTEGFEHYTGAPIMTLWAEQRVVGGTSHMSNAEADRKTASAINAAGGDAEVKVLTELGIHGNGHMMMQNTNSDQVAQVMVDWLAAKLG